LFASNAISLHSVYDGWDSYQTSLVHDIAPLTPEQLAWRTNPELRSVGEIALHITFRRIGWFHNMGAPGSAGLIGQTALLDSQGMIARNTVHLVKWLEASWQMIENTLDQWSVADLTRTYRLDYQGKTYNESRQWTIWRILSHDIHHGGQLAIMLGMQGIDIPELGDQGGHLTLPPLAVPG
jgi:uncharacterized damage-inducible protein DinB